MATIGAFPNEWPDKFKSLKTVDNLLRCPICFEYMETAMILPKCSHNYCSVCVRKFLSFKTQCPTCTEPVSESELRNNRLLDELIRNFALIREKLLEAVHACVDDIDAGHRINQHKAASLTSSPSPQAHRSQHWTAGSSTKKHKINPGSSSKKSTQQSIRGSCVPQKRYTSWEEEEADIKTPKSRKKPRKIVDTDTESETDSDVIMCEDDVIPSTRSMRESRQAKSAANSKLDTLAEGGQIVEDSDSDFDVSCVSMFSTPNTHKASRRKVHKNHGPKSSSALKSPPPTEKAEYFDVSATKSPQTVVLKSPSPGPPANKSGTVPSASSPSVKQDWWKSPLSKVRGSTASTSSLQTSSSQESGSGATASGSAGPSTSQQAAGLKRVPCPICGVDVPEKNINFHLDLCLRGDQKKEPRQSNLPKRKAMPKLVYNLMSDKEIRKKLSSVGLPTQGDRKTLIKRHHEFTLVYNSECDSRLPKSAEQIAKQITKNEKTKAQEAITNSMKTQKLSVEKGASAEKIQQAQKSYVKQHKSQFAQLIADVKRRNKKQAKSSTSTSVQEPEIETADLDIPSLVIPQPTGPPGTVQLETIHEERDEGKNSSPSGGEKTAPSGGGTEQHLPTVHAPGSNYFGAKPLDVEGEKKEEEENKATCDKNSGSETEDETLELVMDQSFGAVQSPKLNPEETGSPLQASENRGDLIGSRGKLPISNERQQDDDEVTVGYSETESEEDLFHTESDDVQTVNKPSSNPRCPESGSTTEDEAPSEVPSSKPSIGPFSQGSKNKYRRHPSDLSESASGNMCSSASLPPWQMGQGKNAGDQDGGRESPEFDLLASFNDNDSDSPPMLHPIEKTVLGNSPVGTIVAIHEQAPERDSQESVKSSTSSMPSLQAVSQPGTDKEQDENSNEKEKDENMPCNASESATFGGKSLAKKRKRDKTEDSQSSDKGKGNKKKKIVEEIAPKSPEKRVTRRQLRSRRKQLDAM